MRTQINNTLLLGAIIVAGFSSRVSAQTTEAAKADTKTVRFGFKASPNLSWVKVFEGRVKNNGMGLGISYGLMGDFNIGNNPNYWIGAEAIVTSMPSNIAALDTLYITNNNLSQPYANTEFNYKLQYIQIPITLKLKTNEIGNMMYWGQFGLSPAFMIQNRVSTLTSGPYYKTGVNSHSPNSSGNDGLDFNGDSNQEGAFQDNVIPLRMSMVLGAGIEFRISGKTTASIGLRFDNGFTGLFWDDAVKGRNNYLGLNAGVFF
ncbi:MAG: outer membrane beta-barrel protein [Bacteroidia bacterium]|nr:outer membrane beta-barrel protein [Bacteroidia bacterium]